MENLKTSVLYILQYIHISYQYVCSQVTQQLEILYNHLRLSQNDIRLRFLLISEVRNAVQKILPYAKVEPYGSLASGLSRQCSDVDIVIHDDTIVPKVNKGLKKQSFCNNKSFGLF